MIIVRTFSHFITQANRTEPSSNDGPHEDLDRVGVGYCKFDSTGGAVRTFRNHRHRPRICPATLSAFHVEIESGLPRSVHDFSAFSLVYQQPIWP